MSYTKNIIRAKTEENNQMAFNQSESIGALKDANLHNPSLMSRRIFQNEEAKFVIDRCPHTERKYYAKGMCTNCYHNSGRPNKATNCIHKYSMNFAKGLCQSCYQSESF